MPGDQLVGDAPGHVLHVEAGVLGGRDLGVEDHLQQQVAELLPEMIMVAGLDRLDRLGGLLDQVLHQRAMGLLGVPRALPAQPGHHRDQPLQLRQPGRRQLATRRLGQGFGSGVGDAGLASEPD